MVRIKPFQAIRPVADRAADVASVPYDVVTTDEARKLAEGRPYSFLRIVRSEIDFPPNVSPYSDQVYEKAKLNLDELLDGGILTRDKQPGLFLYRLEMGNHQQTGVVCCCHIDDYANNVIKKHEKTRKDKEDDRTTHVLKLNAHAEPVFLAYRDQTTITDLITADTNQAPLYHFQAEDGVTHSVWPVVNVQPYVSAFAEMECAYIADGHHRTASAARAGFERRAANSNHTGEEEYNWFLTVLFPSTQLQILPYNRVITDLNGHDSTKFLKHVQEYCSLQITDDPQPASPSKVCAFLDQKWYELKFNLNLIDSTDPIQSLDVSLLQDQVLDPILGIKDQRTDKRIDFVGGLRGTDELMRRVTDGSAAIAFSMYPTSMDQLLSVADMGEVMPPKSTWFEPKLRSGLFVHSLD